MSSHTLTFSPPARTFPPLPPAAWEKGGGQDFASFPQGLQVFHYYRSETFYSQWLSSKAKTWLIIITDEDDKLGFEKDIAKDGEAYSPARLDAAKAIYFAGDTEREKN